MQHANAPLTPLGTLRMVLLVGEDGCSLQAAAAACNVAKSTCWEWVRRWRQASESERVTLSCHNWLCPGQPLLPSVRRAGAPVH
jgi:transposase-like protein